MKAGAVRGGRELPPTAAPAIGDVLWVAGQPFKLVAVIAAGRGEKAERTYRLRDSKGDTIDITPGGAK